MRSIGMALFTDVFSGLLKHCAKNCAKKCAKTSSTLRRGLHNIKRMGKRMFNHKGTEAQGKEAVKKTLCLRVSAAKNSNLISGLILSSLLTLLSGCAALVDSVNEEPVNIDSSQRTWGSWIDDQTIETVTAVNINKAHPALRESRIKVISFNGIVLLIGQVPDERLKRLAGHTAQNVEKVRQVYNEIEVGPNADIIVQSNDSWLTTKIKTSMVTNDAVVADRIKVNTEQKTVYLMGLVTPKMAQEAVSITANTYGVSRVVKVFEYIQ